MCEEMGGRDGGDDGYQPLSLRVREGRVERINARKEGAL